eukprot:GHVS01103575.1.p1 GENE.GHVS01103575.1~~GHVS01103575.1.p1  ORF type:complete len:449 (-),score=57.10 GHVS01103575.1:161-1507(-)
MSSRRVEIYYYSSWKPASIRYKRLGEHNWHHEEMLDCSDLGHPQWHRLYVEANDGVECVFCKADRSCWDNPPPSYGNCNYLLNINSVPVEYEAPPLPSSSDGSSGGATIAAAGCPLRVVFTIVDGEVELVSGRVPVLVVTDLDGTLLGHDDYLNQFNKMWLKKHVWRGSKLVYNTGRNLKDFLLAAQEHQLHRPDYAVVGVGTEIYSFPSTGGQGSVENSHLRLMSRSRLDKFDSEDDGLVGPDWCSTRFDAVFEEEWLTRMHQCFHRPTAEAIITEEFPGININGNSYHDPWRISLSVQTNDLFHPEINTMNRLRDKFSDCKFVISGAGEWRYVDILPQEAGKLPPIEFLMTQLQFPPSQTLVCGDSGNDIDMFSHPEVLGVCVGNAHDDLVNFLRQTDWSEETDADAALLRKFHQSTQLKPTPNVLFATDPCAGGIVHALKHFGFD